MTAISQTPIQPGSLQYGRSIFLIWDVKQGDEGYGYEYAEVPKGATEAEMIDILMAEGVDIDRINEIIASSDINAVEVIDG